jgi:hypothetical protein
MVKKLVFASVVLALALGIDPVQAIPPDLEPMPSYCYQGRECTNRGQCGYNSGMYLGICHYGHCFCY